PIALRHGHDIAGRGLVPGALDHLAPAVLHELVDDAHARLGVALLAAAHQHEDGRPGQRRQDGDDGDDDEELDEREAIPPGSSHVTDHDVPSWIAHQLSLKLVTSSAPGPTAAGGHKPPGPNMPSAPAEIN